jgi:hypothetical protein
MGLDVIAVVPGVSQGQHRAQIDNDRVEFLAITFGQRLQRLRHARIGLAGRKQEELRSRQGANAGVRGCLTPEGFAAEFPASRYFATGRKSGRFIRKIRSEPALHFRDEHALSSRISLDLVAG